jgi:predicted Zn-dependent peptidase
MSFQKHTFANGLTLVGEPSPSARSCAVGFFVRTGARDESAPESGVSHFLEHMVFKGTPRRTADQVNCDFDRIGASNNAYTSEENTVYYAAVLPEYLPDAVDILADILRPSLRGEDFDLEKNVIIEEIGMYEDQPMSCAYDRARKAFFADHPLGNSVLGSVESIRALTRDQMQAYFDRRYVAPNITVSIAGKFDWDEAVKLVGRQCQQWPTGDAPRLGIRPAGPRATLDVIVKDKLNQEQAILLSPAPSVDSPLRHAADILAMVLGDDSCSRLYWALVDPGLADSADVSYHDYEGTGSFITSYSCEPENTAEILSVIRSIFAEVQHDGITAEELEIAKSKVLSRFVRMNERPMSRMMSVGSNWTSLKQYRSVDVELAAFDAVSLADVRQVLEQFPFDQLSVTALGPLTELQA